MKQIFGKKMLLASLALFSVTSALLAQKEKEEKADTKSTETIIITRKGNIDDKAVIELNGNKIIVNGKELKDEDKNSDISVHRTKIRTSRSGNNVTIAPGNFNFDFNDEGLSVFDEDDNRAMLGVITEGNDKGAEIQSVNKESAAEKAGLKKGDVITKINDKKIETTDDVTDAIRSRKPGDKVTVTYMRDGKEQKATAELGKWKGVKRAWAGQFPVNIPKIDLENLENFGAPRNFNYNYRFDSNRPKLGLSIQDTDDGKGVKVLDVDDESNAAKAGLKEEDVILSVDDKEIKGTEDLTRIMREAPKDKYSFTFKIERGGKTQTLEVKTPRKLKTADL